MIRELLYFLFVFVIIFLIYFLFINRNKLKKKKYQKMGEINYLIKKFNLDTNKINYKLLGNITAIINAFIIAFTCVFISIIPLAFIWQIFIGFVALFGLIFSFYEILGRILIKKGWRKK